MDRIIGMFCILLVLASGLACITEISATLPWLGLFIWTISFGAWTTHGWFREGNNLDVGWKGQFLVIGSRIPFFTGEGHRFAPLGFKIRKIDCRKKALKLDELRGIWTSDNIEVVARDMSLVSQVVDLHRYSSIDPEGFKILYDDITDKNVKEKVVGNDVKTVIKMPFSTTKVETQYDLLKYGIHIDQIIVPTVTTVDPKILADIQLETAEKFERVGQMTEADAEIALIAHYIRPNSDIGYPGMTSDQAREKAQMTIGQATKVIHSHSLDAGTIKAVMDIIGRRA